LVSVKLAIVAVNWDCRSLLVLDIRTVRAVFCAGGGLVAVPELPPEQALSSALRASAR
jgi:hypothetical protein